MVGYEIILEMTMAESTSAQLSESLREGATFYWQRLQELAGPRLLGLTFFGAAALGKFDPLRHTARNVVVFDRIDLDLLRQIGALGPRFGQFGIAAPLAMTPQFIQESLDTFPLELLEVQEQHITLLGEDYFATLRLDREHVRLQCERELKSFLIRMHQGLLTAAGNERRLENVETHIAEGLLRVLRGILWLKGQAGPRSPFDLVAAAGQLVNRPLLGLQEAMNSSDVAYWNKFQDLYADLQALGQLVNGL